jgi:alpha-glucosidase
MAAEHVITSPSERLKVTVSTVDGDKTTYSVALKDGAGWRTLISPSEVAMAIKDGIVWGKNATVQAVSVDSSTARAPRPIKVLYGKTQSLTESYKELSIRYIQGYSIVVRVQNEGVAYRFVSHAADGAITYVAEEKATFNFAEATGVWYPASDYTGIGADHAGTKVYVRYKSGAIKYVDYADEVKADKDAGLIDEVVEPLTNYERWYTKLNSIADIDTSKWDKQNSNNDYHWCVTPVLFGFSSDVKVALTEADLHHYPALYMKRNGTQGMKGVWESYPTSTTVGDRYTGPKVKSRADYIAKSTGAQAYPWRVIIVTEHDKDLLTNQLVFKLSSPQKEGIDFGFLDSVPGISAWEYWHDAILETSGVPSGWNNINAANGVNLYRQYVLLSEKYGFKYITIDTDGQHNLTSQQLRAIVDTAAKHGVKIIKWDYIGYFIANHAMLDGYKNVGFAGLKIDFFYRTDQQGMEVVEELADYAAQRQMPLLLHGCPVPTGLQRTYPNIMSYEAVAGEENYKWDAKREGGRLPTARYHLEIPFIRQLVGPMDFTPGSMHNVHLSQYSPIWNGVPNSIGTRAHELAMFVMYDMPLAYLCDNPKAYYDNPEAMKLLSKVKTTWDESLALDGKVGEYALVAKRKGNAWFVGGMVSETPHTLEVDFSFLPAGETYSAIIYSDSSLSTTNAKRMHAETREVERSAKLTIPCVLEGGLVIQIFKKGSADDPDGEEAPTAVSKHTADAADAISARCTDHATLVVRSNAGSNIVSVSVVNMQGVVAMRQKCAGISPEATVNVVQLPQGIYIASVETANGTYSAKFLKQD